jgi:hypothetical protein
MYVCMYVCIKYNLAIPKQLEVEVCAINAIQSDRQLGWGQPTTTPRHTLDWATVFDLTQQRHKHDSTVLSTRAIGRSANGNKSWKTNSWGSEPSATGGGYRERKQSDNGTARTTIGKSLICVGYANANAE